MILRIQATFRVLCFMVSVLLSLRLSAQPRLNDLCFETKRVVLAYDVSKLISAEGDNRDQIDFTKAIEIARGKADELLKLIEQVERQIDFEDSDLQLELKSVLYRQFGSNWVYCVEWNIGPKFGSGIPASPFSIGTIVLKDGTTMQPKISLFQNLPLSNC